MCLIRHLVHISILVLAFTSTGECTSELELQKETTQLRSASEQAYHLFHLAIAAEDVEDSKPDQVDPQNIVFKEGAVQKNWMPVSHLREEPTPAQLFHHDEYADRISFDFSFGSFMIYDIRTPTCVSSDKDVAKPKVLDFQVDSEEQSGSFSIVYDCYRHPNEHALRNVTVSVVLPVVSGLSLFFSFHKTCGGGKHKHIDFGYFEESQGSMNDVRRIRFADSLGNIKIGPHAMSTKLYIQLNHPAQSQEFHRVNTTSSRNALSLTTRGPIFGGVLKPLESAVIHILYNCHGSGEVNVSVMIQLFPFHALSATWTKDCGGGLAAGLNVGTSFGNKNDVVDKAKTAQSWQLALETTGSPISERVPVVNASIRYKGFWLSNDGITVHVAPAVVTVEDPAILAVFSVNPDANRLGFDQETRSILRQGGKRHLRLKMICKRKGTSLVIVTFPVRSFSNVDFGFVKLCKAPKRYVHSGFLRTAQSLMVTVSLVMGAAFAYWWLPQWKSEKIFKSNKHLPMRR